MIVAGIRLRHFRNHTGSALEFGSGINALLGDNGDGKTNVLEAISFLGLTKSFYAAADATVQQIGAEDFEVVGTLRGESGWESVVRVAYCRARAEKVYEVNGARAETLSSAIGRFPVVILSPENGGITAGGPAERRKFLDLVLSQISATYLKTLLEYRQVVRQRNRVLFDARVRGSLNEELMEVWDENLVALGSALVERRRAFLGEFRTYMVRAYDDVAPGTERPDLVYLPGGFAGDPGGDTRAALRGELRRRRLEELRRGSTQVGPHRDDVGLMLNGIPVQEYASQGQHKTLLVALKVAEYHFVAERASERPILLLDDLFSELDAHRAARILELLGGLGQVIITATDERVFHEAVSWNGANRRFRIERGTSRPIPAA
jgi:DNA replication and repair protein RecF